MNCYVGVTDSVIKYAGGSLCNMTSHWFIFEFGAILTHLLINEIEVHIFMVIITNETETRP